jgi:CheY-like chemotaxis protein
MIDHPAPPRRLRVLVANGSRDSADSLAALVRIWGHDALAAHDGRNTLEESARYRPDVLILGLEMLLLSGTEVAAAVRGRPGPRPLLVGQSVLRPDELGPGVLGEFDRYLQEPNFHETLRAILTTARKLPDG